MLASELVKITHFKKYHFVMQDYRLNEKNLTTIALPTVSFDMKLKNGIGSGLLPFVKNADYNDDIFDISKSFQSIADGKIYVSYIAYCIDKITYKGTNQKIFKIEDIYVINDECFIYVTMNDKK